MSPNTAGKTRTQIYIRRLKKKNNTKTKHHSAPYTCLFNFPIFKISLFKSPNFPITSPQALRSLAGCPLQGTGAILPSIRRPAKFLPAKRAEQRAGNSRPSRGGCGAAATTGSRGVGGNWVPRLSPPLPWPGEAQLLPRDRGPLPAATQRASSTPRQTRTCGRDARTPAAISPPMPAGGSSGSAGAGWVDVRPRP